MRILPCGSNAILLELDDVHDVHGWYAALTEAALPNVVDVVPAARTLLVVSDLAGGRPAGGPDRPMRTDRPFVAVGRPMRTLDDLVRRVHAMRPDPGSRPHDADEGLLEVPVVYDGEDLADVARVLGCAAADVVLRHTNELWSVAFCGFAPGFGYLVPEGQPWNVPRRDVPRRRVPVGAVGLAGTYTGIYPRASPGGWQLVGHTPLELFDPSRQPAAVLTPGRRVRFVDATRRSRSRAVDEPPGDAASGGPAKTPRRSSPASTLAPSHRTDASAMALAVVDPGQLTTVQDEGRTGWASIGVSPSGAADRRSYRLANRLVGNAFGAPALEVTLGGLVLRAERDVLLAVTGAPCAGAPQNASARLRAGDELRLGMPERGLRSYVAVRGGLDVEPVLGSCSTDVLSGLGPSPLRPDDVLALGGAAAEPPAVDVAPVPPVGATAGQAATVRVLPGPRHDWFSPDAWSRLTHARYQVTSDSNRVAVRLDGPVLERSVTGELPSEGIVRGAVQVPSSGQPLVFLADHPTTGGYPVLACVVDDDVDLVAQLRPGEVLRFRSA